VAIQGTPTALAIVAGAIRSVDLNDTLPSNVPRGGSFSVDPAGPSLPAGMSLAANGVLLIAASARVGVTRGVIFNYVTA
jgi:hypothetical protein